MAEVSFEGGEEVEDTIGYTIEFPNTYKNVTVDDNRCNVVIDNQGVNNAILDWADYKEVVLEDTPINLEQALDALSHEIIPETRTRTVVPVEERTIQETEFTFSYDESSGLFVPSWNIEMQNGDEYTIDCVTSEVVGK
jgi:Zn-dependent metalloprotease